MFTDMHQRNCNGFKQNFTFTCNCRNNCRFVVSDKELPRKPRMCTVLADCCRTKTNGGWDSDHRQHWGRKRTIVGYATTRGKQLHPYDGDGTDIRGSVFRGSVYCHHLCQRLLQKGDSHIKDIHQLLYVVGTDVFKCVQAGENIGVSKERKAEIPVCRNHR